MKTLILSNSEKFISPILNNLSSHNIDVDSIDNIEDAESFLTYDKYDALFIDFTSNFDEFLIFCNNILIPQYPSIALIGFGPSDNKSFEMCVLTSVHEYIKNDTDSEIVYLRLKNLLKRGEK